MSCGCKCGGGSKPGGWKDKDVGDESVKNAADFAFDHLKKASNSAYPLKLVAVKKACVQVVAGMNFCVTLEIGGSPSGTTFEKKVVVYRKLDGSMEVTKIE